MENHWFQLLQDVFMILAPVLFYFILIQHPDRKVSSQGMSIISVLQMTVDLLSSNMLRYKKKIIGCSENHDHFFHPIFF